MKRLNEVLHDLACVRPTYRRMINDKLMVLDPGPKGLRFGIKKSSDQRSDRFLEIIAKQGTAAAIMAYTMAHVMTNGPKVFQPQAKNLEALENMTLNVSILEYVQPFETVIIEFPENYSKTLIVPNVLTELDLLHINGPSGPQPEKHEPNYVMLHHDPRWHAILISVQFSSEAVFNTMLYPRFSADTKFEERTLEECLELVMKLDMYEGSMPVTPEENVAAGRVIRAALNAVLVMEERGIEKIGPQNPSHHARLGRHANNRDAVKAAAALQEQMAMPIIYSFDQHVKLYSGISTTGAETGREGGPIRPHWRCGHWKMQPHGPGSTLRKRIRIPAVLVNSRFFGGTGDNTTYTKEM